MVEDNPLDAELIERELRRSKLDFSATRVQTEHTFREALESSDPDVILGDYNLPGFDGVAALKIATSLLPHHPHRVHIRMNSMRHKRSMIAVAY